MKLKSIMYHYVRNPELTPYKGIHAVREEAFVEQIKHFHAQYEMASPEAILDFLKGNYRPRKDLCVLTFDDGLKEHGHFVTEVLNKYKIQGQFFIPTACVTDGYVLPVHKNHFLLATLNFQYYKESFINVLKENHADVDIEVAEQKAKQTYRWDSLEVAIFKYLLNYKLPKKIRNETLKVVFEKELGEENSFAKNLYLTWEEMREMQGQGMIFGGHSHKHDVLSHLSEAEQLKEIDTSITLVKKNLPAQNIYPFCYPFGKTYTFNAFTIECLKKQETPYAYSTTPGDSIATSDPFFIKRVDPKDIKALVQS